MTIIKNHSERLSSIIEDLLSLSRIEQDEGYGMELDPTDIKDVVQRVVEGCEVTAAEKNIRINIDLPDPTTIINLNGALMEQAIMNLLVNAIRYSPENTSVRIHVSQNKTHTTLVMADQGKGIDEKHIPYLFQRFYRVDKARSRQMGGTGLGLAIVKHILQAIQGKLVESRGEGGFIYAACPE